MNDPLTMRAKALPHAAQRGVVPPTTPPLSPTTPTSSALASLVSASESAPRQWIAGDSSSIKAFFAIDRGDDAEVYSADDGSDIEDDGTLGTGSPRVVSAPGSSRAMHSSQASSRSFFALVKDASAAPGVALSVAAVDAHLNTYPRDATTMDSCQMLALHHLAFNTRATWPLLHAIIARAPRACEAVDIWQYTALHWLCENESVNVSMLDGEYLAWRRTTLRDTFRIRR